MTGTMTAAVARRMARFDGGRSSAGTILDRDAGDGARYRGEGRLDGGRDRRRRCIRRRRRRADEPEASLATLVAADGGEEVALGEVGPEHVGEVQLGVGEAVEEEVRDAPLAARANHEIGVADREARQDRKS